jgi:hypothetical protein
MAGLLLDFGTTYSSYFSRPAKHQSLYIWSLSSLLVTRVFPLDLSSVRPFLERAIVFSEKDLFFVQ